MCTTILVGKGASYDGSTLVARIEDSSAGMFKAKKFIVVEPKDQPIFYKSVRTDCEIELPKNPMRYTCLPNVKKWRGVWGACGVNEKNVSMTATETITSNERVLGADPLIEFEPYILKKGGIGEEDFVVITLPYISTAKEGAKRLGSLIEKYGTYESNGIAFQDENDIWWFETIGGHHWIARRVPDDVYVVMPNQFGLDHFDFEDAFGKEENFMCSSDLKDFIKKYHLDLTLDGDFNPRDAFGSHSDADILTILLVHGLCLDILTQILTFGTDLMQTLDQIAIIFHGLLFLKRKLLLKMLNILCLITIKEHLMIVI